MKPSPSIHSKLNSHLLCQYPLVKKKKNQGLSIQERHTAQQGEIQSSASGKVQPQAPVLPRGHLDRKQICGKKKNNWVAW